MSKPSIGHLVWAIPEGYIPATSHGPAPELTSHEAVCILNAGEQDAQVELTVHFEDSDPVGPYVVNVRAGRTLHLRFNDLADRRAAHTARLAAGRKRAAVHNRLFHARLKHF
ncbi:MAG TPA: sensory rhodopsin transducer [Lacipirellulaceae bacterium]|nr:sensory rhodopsin transducer [Lacipirellulaceae bacterium]